MKWLIWLLVLPLGLILGGLLGNQPPLLSPPGPLVRLKTYLTTNLAETAPDHPFPELRPPRLSADLPTARARLRAAMEALGWQEIRTDAGDGLRAVVVTPLLRFRDDLAVRLEPRGGEVWLHARSASRLGRGDLGANARHLRELFAAVGARP